MGKICKYCNIYDRNGNLIRHVDEKTGRLKPYTIQELEEYIDTLEKGTLEYNNCISWLIGMYQNPKTKEDKEYVKQQQENLIKKLQDAQNEKKRREEAGKASLEQLKQDIEDTEVVEPVPDSTEGTNTGGTKE